MQTGYVSRGILLGDEAATHASTGATSGRDAEDIGYGFRAAARPGNAVTFDKTVNREDDCVAPRSGVAVLVPGHKDEPGGLPGGEAGRQAAEAGVGGAPGASQHLQRPGGPLYVHPCVGYRNRVAAHLAQHVVSCEPLAASAA